MTSPLQRFRALAMGASLGLVAIVGLVDYLTGFELFFFAFYLLPVSLAAWFVGRGFAFVITMLCVAASVGGDVIAGARYSSRFVLVWNGLIEIALYFVVVWILSKLRSLYDELEARVRQRTAALHAEMRERTRLEEEILRVSEREQRRIGHDLHDSLCQHLTATALAGQVLREQLAQPAQADSANRIVRLIEDAIELTRTLARGLHPIELRGEGLMDALRELTQVVRERFKIDCRFDWLGEVTQLPPEDAIQLYRIAQEAANNAVRHSRATLIVIRLEGDEETLRLTICDNGVGMPQTAVRGQGMGLRIMAHRASLLEATFKIEPRQPSGTCVTCVAPASRPANLS